MKNETYKKTIEFIDNLNHRVIAIVEITNRNNYPEFTMSGRYLGSWGQCFDDVEPKGIYQAQLIDLWKKYHLKDISEVEGFRDTLIYLLNNIEAQEEDTEETLEQQMQEYGIDEDYKEACQAYLDIMGSGTDLRDFEESYVGEFNDDEEFAQEQAESCGMIDKNSTWPNNCIDWE